MIPIFDFKRISGEAEEGYLWRIGQAKDSGLLEMDWNSIAKIMNSEFREDQSEYRTEAAYRKRYSEAKKFYDAGVFKSSESEQLKELQQMKDEVYKAKKQLSDQRREYNKLLTLDARADHLTDRMIMAANMLNDNYPFLLQESKAQTRTDKEALICFADWHYGMITDNIWNKYNTEICKKRLSWFVSNCIDYIELNQISTVHIVLLGDLINGAIHTTSRVKSEEDTCDQLMNVSELVAQSVNRISYGVDKVHVYTCCGNHARTVQNKKDSVYSDNMEKIIPWWLRQRLQNNHKITINDSEYKEFTRINILGKNICVVHGDLDKFKNLGVTVNTIFSQKFGETIDYTVSADKHHLEEVGVFNTESILVRSLCGTDDHANGLRLYDKPGQTMIVFNSIYGRESTYHVPLN